MPVLSTLLAASAVAALPNACAWDDPGRDPYMGDVAAAVAHYTDIPADVRGRLKARVEAHDYDDIVEIRRDGIEGEARGYAPDITHMHFGDRGLRCVTVSRDGWSEQHRERGLVYCEDRHCILVPTVCRNVARIVPAAPVVPVADVPPVSELELDPPAAGPVPVAPSRPFAGPPVAYLLPPPVPREDPLRPAGPPPLGATPAPSMEPVRPAPLPIAPPVPEPAVPWLMAMGAGLVAWRRRRGR